MTLPANSFGDLAAAEGSPVIKRTGQPVIGRRVGVAWVTAVVIVAAVGFAGSRPVRPRQSGRLAVFRPVSAGSARPEPLWALPC